MNEITSPIAGRMFEINVKPGDKIHKGDEVLIIESMKMEIPIVAESEGIVKSIEVSAGEAVDSGQLLLRFE